MEIVLLGSIETTPTSKCPGAEWFAPKYYKIYQEPLIYFLMSVLTSLFQGASLPFRHFPKPNREVLCLGDCISKKVLFLNVYNTHNGNWKTGLSHHGNQIFPNMQWECPAVPLQTPLVSRHCASTSCECSPDMQTLHPGDVLISAPASNKQEEESNAMSCTPGQIKKPLLKSTMSPLSNKV